MTAPTTVTMSLSSTRQTKFPSMSSVLKLAKKQKRAPHILSINQYSKKEIPFSSISIHNENAPIAVIVIKTFSLTVDKKTPSEVEAVSLLNDIRDARDDQAVHVTRLDKEIQEQMELYIAHEMMGGCTVETEACLQKANRLKHKRELTLTAIDFLDMHILTLESEIEEARFECRSVDFSEHTLFALELNDILQIGQ